MGLPDFSCFKFFIFQCFEPVTLVLSKNEIHLLLPYIFNQYQFSLFGNNYKQTKNHATENKPH